VTHHACLQVAFACATYFISSIPPSAATDNIRPTIAKRVKAGLLPSPYCIFHYGKPYDDPNESHSLKSVVHI
jgi:hypothetical protein